MDIVAAETNSTMLRTPDARFLRRLLIGTALGLASTPLWAGNGLNLIGFGARSVAMGGTAIAAADDTSTLNTNPAGLAGIPARALDAYGAVAFALDVAHADAFGNDRRVSNARVPIAGGGYAARLAAGPVVVGVGFFAQGGAGNVYTDIATPFGTRDELSGLFRIARFTPGIAWQAGDKWRFGASLSLNLADIRQKVFPDTSSFNASDPAMSFFGIELKDARSTAWGYRIGAQYRASERITLGATYAGKVPLALKHGRLTADMVAIGLGKVTYRDAAVDGLALAQEFGLGAAIRPAPSWLVAIDLRWFDWSHALTTSRLTARNPDNPAAPPEIDSTAHLDWHDQYVLALGAEYRWDEATALRAGINYGRNPIPGSTTNPLLAAMGEEHLTFGVVHRVDPEWEVTAGAEYLLPKKVRYDNPELPFGPGTEERVSYIAVHAMVSRRW